ncbi:DUF6265 family protein [Chitinophaga sp. Cy-1792]|uniref:DUF6265 family protein n=1 Tax=Chitinophaga sp. Cy-1792 TaxID=2608339 RepID=UPI00141FECB4|nr:DUF6265 family protein [Chitinophaga sp. Cy-1792]NIG54634.1 hypothetical protein [Chitinophaga sp. Cy-1792]
MVKKLLWSSSLLLIILGCCLQASAQANAGDFGYLNKLEGTWTMRTKHGAVMEAWVKRNDSTWTGKTWRVAAGDTALQQSVELVRRGADVYFIPSYTGHETFAPIRLRVRVLKAIGFVAEDLKNDFPQKVTYRFSSEKMLEARVQGTRDGTVEEYIFKYSK